MSYSLLAFLTEPADAASLHLLLGEADLRPTDGSLAPTGFGSGAEVLTKSGEYCFNAYGPDLVPEDRFPELDRYPQFRWAYALAVEGSDPHRIQKMTDFATLLVERLGGLLSDPQSESIHTLVAPSRPAASPKPPKDIILITLWSRPRDLPPEPASVYLNQTYDRFPMIAPERLMDDPRREFRWNSTSAEQFELDWKTRTNASPSFFFTGPRPLIIGLLSDPPAKHTKTWDIWLAIRGETLTTAPAIEAFLHDLGALCDAMGAYYASAEVLQDQEIRGADFWSASSGGDVEIEKFNQFGWLGIPQQPIWVTWLGPDYVSLVGDVPPEKLTMTTTGAMIVSNPNPLPRDQLEPLTTYLPMEVFSRVVDARAEYLPQGV